MFLISMPINIKINQYESPKYLQYTSLSSLNFTLSKIVHNLQKKLYESSILTTITSHTYPHSLIHTTTRATFKNPRFQQKNSTKMRKTLKKLGFLREDLPCKLISNAMPTKSKVFKPPPGCSSLSALRWRGRGRGATHRAALEDGGISRALLHPRRL